MCWCSLRLYLVNCAHTHCGVVGLTQVTILHSTLSAKDGHIEKVPRHTRIARKSEQPQPFNWRGRPPHHSALYLASHSIAPLALHPTHEHHVRGNERPQSLRRAASRLHWQMTQPAGPCCHPSLAERTLRRLFEQFPAAQARSVQAVLPVRRACPAVATMQHSRATHHKVLCRKPSVAFNLHARASVKACTCERSIRKASKASITHTHTHTHTRRTAIASWNRRSAMCGPLKPSCSASAAHPSSSHGVARTADWLNSYEVRACGARAAYQPHSSRPHSEVAM